MFKWKLALLPAEEDAILASVWICHGVAHVTSYGASHIEPEISVESQHKHTINYDGYGSLKVAYTRHACSIGT